MFVGSCEMQIRDEGKGLSFAAVVLYPTCMPSAPTAFGPYTLEVSPNAAVAEGRFPLIVISHGSGGWHLLYRSIAEHLARNGYVVALLEHAGNNRNHNTLAGTVENLVNRPRHVRLLIDAIMGDARFSPRMEAEKVGIIGHSIGGYTALAVAGGLPWSETWGPVEVAPDRRVGALVLLAPVTTWFRRDDALKDVTIPILMVLAEHDAYTARGQADLLLDRVPDRARVTLKVIENAGHFSFLTPFPPQMKNPKFPPSTDPEGFDRDKFHRELPEDILVFLDETLGASRASH
jgi:predicted dienelactone hydrolase